MASEGDAADGTAQESVVLASFENRHAAEHMLFSLGRGFRNKSRRAGTTAFVVTANKDGSLKLAESRALEVMGLTALLVHLSVSWTVGFLGVVSTLKGVKATAHAAHEQQSHVGSDDQRAQGIIAEAGPDAAIMLVRCEDEKWSKPSPPELVTGAVKAGMARSRSSLPAWTPAARTTGYAPRSTCPPAATASPPRSRAAPARQRGR
jgi:hypothetical protein